MLWKSEKAEGKVSEGRVDFRGAFKESIIDRTRGDNIFVWSLNVLGLSYLFMLNSIISDNR